MKKFRINHLYKYRYNLYFFLFPIIEFLDFAFIKPIEYFQVLPAQRLSFPLLTLLYSTGLIFIPNRSKPSKNATWIFLILSVVSLFSKNLWLIGIIWIELLILYAFLSRDGAKSYFKSYAFGYFFICISGFFIRLLVFGIPYWSVRGGANIWGGLTLVSTMIGASLLYYNEKRISYLFVFMAFLAGCVFASRTGLLLSMPFIVIAVRKTGYKIKLLIAVVLVALYFIFQDAFELQMGFIRGRFDGLSMDNLEDSRFHIWNDSISIFKDRPLVPIGLGNYPLYSYRGFGNSHDFFLTLLLEAGLFALVIFFRLFIETVNLLSTKSAQFIFLYLLYLGMLNLGVPLIQATGDFSMNSLLLLLLIIDEKKYA